jgi:hypothetical protein
MPTLSQFRRKPSKFGVRNSLQNRNDHRSFDEQDHFSMITSRSWFYRNLGRVHGQRQPATIAEIAGDCNVAHKQSFPSHSWSIPRINRAESNSTEPGGNNSGFSKKLDFTFSTSNGCTRQLKLCSSSPSNCPGTSETEYPKDPRSKNLDASVSDPKTEVLGRSEATCPLTSKCVCRSSLDSSILE